MKIQEKTKSVVFNMRMDEDTKKKLDQLAKGVQFDNNSSAVIRSLIHAQHSKKGL